MGKSNGKRGCAGVRLINVLDPGGKVFFKYLWGDAKPPQYAYTYGFRKGRRREQAILILHCVRWKLRQMGLSHTTTLHDVANAFPSPEHEDLHAMVDTCAREGDEGLLKVRCSDTVVVIGGHGGQEIAVKPGCGGMQGDTSMPPMFSATYDPGIDIWVREQEEIVDEGISAVDPLTGEEMQLRSTLYADDAQETHVTEDRGEIREIMGASGGILDRELGMRGMARNVDKEEHLVSMVGGICREVAGGSGGRCRDRGTGC